MENVDTKGSMQAARIDQHVGDRIRRRRTLLGFTQEQLADALQISYQQIQKYETGSNRVSAGRLFQIAQRLDVPVSYFFEGLDNHAIAASAIGTSAAPSAAARTTIELVRNFNAIGDGSVRSAVSSLVKSLSAQNENGSGQADDASSFGQFAAGPGRSTSPGS